MASDRAKNLIGLAQKAGRVASGEFACEKAIRSGQAQLVIIAEDASANTKKKFTDKAAYYEVPALFFESRASLGAIIGKGERACLAILDAGLGSKNKDHLTN